MAVQFKIGKDKYTYPQDWRDVSLGDFVRFFEVVEPKKPKRAKEIAELSGKIEGSTEPERIVLEAKIQELIDGLTQEEHDTQYIPYKIAYVGFYCRIDAENVLSVGEVEALYAQISKNLSDAPNYKDEPKSLIFDGVEYQFPSAGLKGSVASEYFAANQIIDNLDHLAHGNYKALPDLMGVFLRPTGVPYKAADAKLRAKEFLKMPMSEAWKFYFFLQRLNRQSGAILQYFSIVRASLTIPNKAKRKSGTGGYWSKRK